MRAAAWCWAALALGACSHRETLTPVTTAPPRVGAVPSATSVSSSTPASASPSCRARCAVPFTFRGPEATRASAVELRGDFSEAGGSEGRDMRRGPGGTWTTTVYLAPGQRVETRYCVDPRTDGGCGALVSGNVVAPVACATTECEPPPSPPAAVVRFLAVGDTGKGNTGQQQVAAAMAKKCKASGCDFVMLLGDNLYESGASSPTDPLFDTLFESVYADVPAPFYVALGNHDYGGAGLGDEPWKADNEVRHTSLSAKWRMPARYFQFARGDVAFFVLDTNAQLYGQAREQQADVQAWIGRATSTWKIAVGHHPYLSNGPHGNAGAYNGRPAAPVANGAAVKAFAESVWCGKVDLFLSGHDHSRQWLESTCQGTELVVSGAGATTTSVGGTNRTRYQSSDLGFLYVVIQGRRLTADFYDVGGAVTFSRILTK